MSSLSNWLLAGALAASLAWNGYGAWRGNGGDPAACAVERTACASASEGGDAARDEASLACATSCSPAALAGLDPAQRAALERLATTSCAGSERLEREADALQRRLVARLAAEELDADAARAIVGEVAELRRRALAACVDAILELRRVLTRSQVEALLARCAEGTCR